MWPEGSPLRILRSRVHLQPTGRSKHAWATATSASVAGWKLTRMQPLEEPLPDLFPGNRRFASGVDVGDTAFDLGRPQRINV